MVVKYGDGTTYGEADAFYGPVSAALLAAQLEQSRETGLKVSIIDENLNNWTKLTGTEFREIDYEREGGALTLTYRHYRARSFAIKLSNGNIIRARIGDGSQSDRQLYLQTITDPTSAAQWNAWSVQYSGDHVAVALVATGASTYDIYHSKLDGKLYKNNVEIWDPIWGSRVKGIIDIRPVEGGTAGAMFIRVVYQSSYDNGRVINLFYTDDINSTTPEPDILNYEWSRVDAWGYVLDDGRLARLQSIGMFSGPRAARGDSVVVNFMPDDTWVSNRRPTPLRLIRGVGSDWGHNEINNPRMFKLSDGYWYMFYNEHHTDEQYQLISDTYTPLVWQRSKDMLHWSEPVHTGIAGLTNFSVFETDDRVYLVGNSEVWYRPKNSTTYDISNYVPTLNMEMPRDNQPGSANCVVANPNGVNDAILHLGDRRAEIEVGIKNADGQFEFVKFNDWWVKRVTRQIEGSANRLAVDFVDVWDRLSNPLRDTFNFLGQTLWEDWAEGKRNKSFNYFFVSDTSDLETKETSDFKLNTRGVVLYTGWKGHNPDAKVTFSGVSGNPALIFRYVDEKNYMRVELQGSTLRLIAKNNGSDSIWESVGVSPGSTYSIRADVVFGSYKIYFNDVLVMDDFASEPESFKPGYVGFSGAAYKVSNFILRDWEVNLTFADLIRTALAMGDYHDVIVGNADGKAYNLMWGPQTDLPTPANGLENILETAKLQLIWKDGFINVGQFKDTSVVREIRDRIIQTEHTEEAPRRINMAIVDGNEHTWHEVDETDTQQRDRQIIGYFDLPELLEWDSVKERAREEIRRGKIGSAPGGTVVLFFDLRRMDVVNWIDNVGNENKVRIEGMSIQIEQGTKPRQVQQLDTSLI